MILLKNYTIFTILLVTIIFCCLRTTIVVGATFSNISSILDILPHTAHDHHHHHVHLKPAEPDHSPKDTSYNPLHNTSSPEFIKLAKETYDKLLPCIQST